MGDGYTARYSIYYFLHTPIHFQKKHWYFIHSKFCCTSLNDDYCGQLEALTVNGHDTKKDEKILLIGCSLKTIFNVTLEGGSLTINSTITTFTAVYFLPCKGFILFTHLCTLNIVNGSNKHHKLHEQKNEVYLDCSELFYYQKFYKKH